MIKLVKVNDLTRLSAYVTMRLLIAYWVIVALARWPSLFAQAVSIDKRALSEY